MRLTVQKARTSGARLMRVGCLTASQAHIVTSSLKARCWRASKQPSQVHDWGSHRLCEAKKHLHAQTELWAAAAHIDFVSMAYLQADTHRKMELLVSTAALHLQPLTSALPYALSKDSRHCSKRICRAQAKNGPSVSSVSW